MSAEITWSIYLFLVVAGFWILELPALLNKKEGDTLSEVTRHWLGLGEYKGLINPWHRAIRIGFCCVTVGLPVWFLFHIITGLV